MLNLSDRNAFAALLRSRGITPTHQRLEIAQVLFSRQRHLSADQILSFVNKDHSETSKATVYNTLKLFLEKGLIRSVIVDPGKVFYDPNTTAHHHFFDMETGELTDIDGANISVHGLPPLPKGIVNEGVDIVVRIRRGRPE